MSDAEMAAARSHVASTLDQAVEQGHVVYDDGLQQVTDSAARGTWTARWQQAQIHLHVLGKRTSQAELDALSRKISDRVSRSKP